MGVDGGGVLGVGWGEGAWVKEEEKAEEEGMEKGEREGERGKNGRLHLRIQMTGQRHATRGAMFATRKVLLPRLVSPPARSVGSAPTPACLWRRDGNY